MSSSTVLLLLCCILAGVSVDALTGKTYVYYTTRWSTYQRNCGLYGWGRCTATRSILQRQERCQTNWRDDGTGNCSIPICTTPCYNGGTCVSPNTCKCADPYKGPNCVDA